MVRILSVLGLILVLTTGCTTTLENASENDVTNTTQSAIQLLLEEAYLKLQHGSYQQAILLFNKALESDSLRQLQDQIFIGLADTYAQLHDYEQAILFYEKLDSCSPTFLRTHKVSYKLGSLYYLTGKYHHAINYLKKTIYTDSLTHQLGKVYYQLAESQKKCDDYYSAIKNYRYALEEYKILADYIQLALAECYVLVGNIPEALIHYNRLISNYPNSRLTTTARLRAAELYEQLNDFPAAIEQYRVILNTHSQDNIIEPDELQYRIATAYKNNNQPDVALELYRKLVINYPRSEYSLYSRRIIPSLRLALNLPESAEDIYFDAIVDYYIKAYESLIKKLTRFIKLYPTHKYADDAQFLIAKGRYKQAEYKLALQEFEKVIVTCPNGNCFDDAQFYKAKCELLLNYSKSAIQQFQEFVLKSTAHGLADDALWIVGNWYENKKDYPSAITEYQKIIKKYPYRQLADQAYWRIGWCWYKSKQYQNAITWWKDIDDSEYSHPVLQGRRLYWIGKAYLQLGDSLHAFVSFNRLIKQNYCSYYTGRAEIELLTNKLTHIHSTQVSDNIDTSASKVYLHSSTSTVTDRFKHNKWESITNRPLQRVFHFLQDCEPTSAVIFYDISSPEPLHLIKGKELLSVGKLNEAISEFRVTEKQNKQDKKLLWQLTQLYSEHHQYYYALHTAMKIASLVDKKLIELPLSLQRALYPVCYLDAVQKYAERYRLNRLLIFAIIREESKFDIHAVSRSNAIGLMQIIPTTAEYIARALQPKNFTIESLYHPAVNIEFGCWYFSQQLNEFNGKLELALAAYNGGPTNVKKWMRQHPYDDISEFVENIEFRETRDYIKKVLTSFWIYRELWDEYDNHKNTGLR